MRRLALSAIPALALLALPGIAMAQARLVSATPAANSTVAKPQRLTLTFSAEVAPAMTGIELAMTGMPSMASHKPMTIKGFQTAVQGNVLTVTMPRPLPAGTYSLKWHAMGADQHHAEGEYAFTVR